MSTNNELKELMGKVPLGQAQVAAFTESSVEAVKGWCAGVESTRFRKMPLSKLKLLKFELREQFGIKEYDIDM